MSKVDLHIHSTASDGRFSPAEVVRKAAKAGLTVIALADHDSINGIAPALEAAKAFPGLKVIPSVEINTDVPKGEAHILEPLRLFIVDSEGCLSFLGPGLPIGEPL